MGWATKTVFFGFSMVKLYSMCGRLIPSALQSPKPSLVINTKAHTKYLQLRLKMAI
jgi:hypothetical protein